jgi:glycerophosphoryl diester phosphodiesterase
MNIIEQFVKGKNSRCEDKIFSGNRFISVIDGATSKNNITYGDLSGGEKAAEIIYSTLESYDNSSSDFSIILDAINLSFNNTYAQFNINNKDPLNKMAACLILYDALSRELILIGDCQGLFETKNHKKVDVLNEKELDAITSNARSLFNHTLISTGQETVDSLMHNDKGRAFIMPLLQSQSNLQNQVCEYGYGVVDGDDIPQEHIKRVRLDQDVVKVTLTSDGYPKVCQSLSESEDYLLKILINDPLMITDYKSTKGLAAGHESFDDRAYISFNI